MEKAQHLQLPFPQIALLPLFLIHNQAQSASFLEAMWWEFWQNFIPIICFIFAVWLWSRGQKWQALGAVIVGGTLGALIIRFTEQYVSNHFEPVSVTIVNIISFSVLMFLFAIYLGTEARWSNKKMDWLLGGLAGVTLSLLQGLADPGSTWLGIAAHCIALGLGFPLALAGMRTLKSQNIGGAIVGAIGITLIVTLAIGLIDYTYLIL